MSMIVCQSNLCNMQALILNNDWKVRRDSNVVRKSVFDCQMRNVSLPHFMQLFHSAVKAAGQLISQMLTGIRL